MLEMSQRDRDRLVVVRQVVGKRATVTRGAQLLGLSRKQMGRLRNRYLEEGDAAVIHRGRGRRSNRAKPEPWRQRFLERAREPLFHDFRPTLRAEHLSRDPEIGPVDTYTLRRWMIEESLWKVKRRGARHRTSRPRRAAVGELVQWDSSDHAWLEDRYPKRLTLVIMIDDASSRLQYARCVEQDNGRVNREAVTAYLERALQVEESLPHPRSDCRVSCRAGPPRGSSPTSPEDARSTAPWAILKRNGLEREETPPDDASSCCSVNLVFLMKPPPASAGCSVGLRLARSLYVSPDGPENGGKTKSTNGGSDRTVVVFTSNSDVNSTVGSESARSLSS
jgi:hypothetical protein